MKTLIEFYGHSGLGKSSLAYALVGRLKLGGVSSELHVEEMKKVCLGMSSKTPEEARETDTKNILKLAKHYSVVVSDTNPYSGYIFGDCSKESSDVEAEVRHKPFHKVIKVFLLPTTDIQIDPTGRLESKLDTRFLERVESLVGAPNSVVLELDKHADEGDFIKLVSEIEVFMSLGGKGCVERGRK